MQRKSFFDIDGRCTTNLTNKEVYKKSRKYFYIDEKLRSQVTEEQIYKNIKKFHKIDITIKFDNFLEKIQEIKSKVSLDKNLSNIDKCIHIPFIIPQIKKHEDIGLDLSEILIPSLKKAYEHRFPEYNFINYCQNKLHGRIKILKNSRYEKLLEVLKEREIVGILYLSLNEFSYPAAEETLSNLPKILNLAGPYEIFSSLIGVPDLLYRHEKYSPLLWMSAITDNQEDYCSYHIESYGYDLTFNKRSHLNQAAEYWWHSLSITDF
jgi:hypothetical protein